MKSVIDYTKRLIYKELESNPRLDHVGVVEFYSKHKPYKFKMYSVQNRYIDWLIELWEVGDEDETKLDELICNAGHKKGLCLMAELLIRRHLGGK